MCGFFRYHVAIPVLLVFLALFFYHSRSVVIPPGFGLFLLTQSTPLSRTSNDVFTNPSRRGSDLLQHMSVPRYLQEVERYLQVRGGLVLLMTIGTSAEISSSTYDVPALELEVCA